MVPNPIALHLRAMRLSALFNDLLENERTGGALLVICTALSLVLANSGVQHGYAEIWHADMLGRPMEFWINDGLMTIFFLMIGLELKRELRVGELSEREQALLPAIAALGGMLVPAGIHLLLNTGTPTASGAGIPMATDIAFAVGILSLLGPRVPPALKVFLMALAVIDDLGAICTIALFYSHGLAWEWLGAAALVVGLLLLMKRIRWSTPLPFLAVGLVLWYCVWRSGVHATISGVVLAFTIPFGDGGPRTLAGRLQGALHRPVAFVIMPLFALANTCITLEPGWMDGLVTRNGLGILLGLVLGKPVGIMLAAALAVALGWCKWPEDTRRPHLIGAGMLGGIGFTMSIFITLLAFPQDLVVNEAKTAILLASLLAGLLGSFVLWRTLPAAPVAERDTDQDP